MDAHRKQFEDDILKSEVPVLVEFHADWCGPCKKMAPIVDDIRTQLNGKVKIFVLNIAIYPELADTFAVLSLPTFIAYRDGKKIWTLTGIQKKEDLVALLS